MITDMTTAQATIQFSASISKAQQIIRNSFQEYQYIDGKFTFYFDTCFQIR